MNKLLKTLFLSLFLSFSMTEGFSQEFYFNQNRTILRGGFSINMGTHANKIGVFTAVYQSIGRAVLNARLDVKYVHLMLGPRLRGVESLFTLGGKIGFEESLKRFESLANPEEFLTNYKYSVGYNFNLYMNDMELDQQTGTINLRIAKFVLEHENDILGEVASDKFRTAAMGMYYQDSLMIFGSEFILWTGNKDDPEARRVYESSFARYGFFDLSDTKFGRNSHGILNFNVKRDLGLGIITEAELGIDHEKIRNTIQNKFMHDMWIWPEKWNKAKNLHITMLDAQGLPFVYEEGQLLKPSSIYFQLNMNSRSFY